MTTTAQIDAFWSLKRLAVVGVSRDPKHFSTAIWRELRDRRYDVVPVNPLASEIDGRPCAARVQDIEPPVDGVVILTPASATDAVVRDCIEAGVRHVWMHKGAGGGPGAVSTTAVASAEAAGIEVIAGYCPFMFLPGTPFFHGLHGAWKKLTRSYPKAGARQ
jgi:predicted CoA-binding protein